MSDELDRRLRHYREIIEQLDETMVLLTLYEVGVFDELLDGPRSVSALAQELGVGEHRLEAFLLLAHEYEFLHRDGERYRLMPGDRELFDPTNDYRKKLRLGSVEDYFGSRLAAPKILRSGEHAERAGGGDDVDEEARRNFLEGLHRRSIDVAGEVAEHLEAPDVERVLDVGCGAGTYAFELLQRLPEARATLIDRPNATSFVREVAEGYGLEDRMTFQPGDVFEDDLGSDYDLAILSNVLHCFGPSDNQRLLGRVREALDPDGRLAVKDLRYPRDDHETVQTLRFNLRMALYTSEGRLYRRGQIIDWLLDAGFESVSTYGLLESSNAQLLVAS